MHCVLWLCFPWWGRSEILGGCTSQVNFHSNMWLEWLFWTFTRLTNNSSFIATEKAAHCVRCEQYRTWFSFGLSCQIRGFLIFLCFSFTRLCNEVQTLFEKWTLMFFYSFTSSTDGVLTFLPHFVMCENNIFLSLEQWSLACVRSWRLCRHKQIVSVQL